MFHSMLNNWKQNGRDVGRPLVGLLTGNDDSLLLQPWRTTRGLPTLYPFALKF